MANINSDEARLMLTTSW